MDENDRDTEITADACCAKSAEEQIKEIIRFVSTFFLIENEDPTVDEIDQAKRLAKLTLLIMSQLMEVGMRQGKEPVFCVVNYIKQLSGGMIDFHYAFETIGGEVFEKFNLGLLAREIESAIISWNKKSFGEVVSGEAAEFLQKWGDVLKDEPK